MSNNFGDHTPGIQKKVVAELETLCKRRMNEYGFYPDSYILTIVVVPTTFDNCRERVHRPTPAEDCPSDGA